MSTLTIQHLSKSFAGVEAVREVTLEIASGEFFSILGPSGCGKTTLLRLIAGFEKPTGGMIFLDGKNVTALPPQERGIGMVFQNYALFPHMTVFGNVAFGLETKKVPRAEIRPRVEAALDAVHLLHKINTPVPSLSGGEQQRVAVARALVVRPAVLLFDEPLSNLDNALRQRMREEIRSLQQSTGITTIYVTHDQSEAMSLSDRIGVMNEGVLMQVGPPAEVYDRPNSTFVAEFVGGANVLRGIVNRSQLTVTVGRFVIAVPQTLLADRHGGPVSLIVKPEALMVVPKASSGEYEGTLLHKEYHGFTTHFLVACNGVQLRAAAVSNASAKQLRAGDTVGLTFDWSRCIVLDEQA